MTQSTTDRKPSDGAMRAARALYDGSMIDQHEEPIAAAHIDREAVAPAVRELLDEIDQAADRHINAEHYTGADALTDLGLIRVIAAKYRHLIEPEG